MSETTIPADRYQRRELLQPGAVETWAGIDQRLERPVTIRRADAASEIGHRLRLQAKALARLEHHGLLHILDTYDEVGYFAIVTEQLPTRTLAEEVTAPNGEPRRLASAEAVRVAIAVTEALAALHSAGFAHGGVEADNIGWRGEVGWVILNGPPTDDAVTIPATRRADLVALAVLVHRLIVGAAPLPRPDGGWELDRLIPDALVPVLQRTIDPTDAWPDVLSMLLALRAVVDDLPPEHPGPDDRRSVWQAERQWLLPVGVLVAAAATLVGIAVVIDQPPEPESAPSAFPETTASVATATSMSAPSATVPVQLGTAVPPTAAPATTVIHRDRIAVESITDFDPAGDDRVEHPERLIFINDGDPTTGWSTARYSTRDFGGLKDGVGLIVVLAGGGTHRVTRLAIDSPTVGWAFEVYASAERNRTLIDWGSPLAVAEDIIGTTVIELPGVDAAALLVWITDLGDELPSGGHRVTITRIDASTSTIGVSGPAGTDAVTP